MHQKPARVRIVDAAHELMLSIGLARATTKEIAKAADCSEAALYKYFANKEELFVTVLSERLPKLGPLLAELSKEPGAKSVEENLTEIAREAALFYEQTFPMAASLYAEPQLKRRHEEALREMGTGPHRPIQGLDAYLRSEQDAGRVSRDADTYAAASLLLGACAQRAFAYDMAPDRKPPQPLDEFAASLARTLLTGIA
ncbi:MULTISPECIES: TetR/AcrR family transcriptional regulator [unclassified Streptomyces]|uniref:TetR/AcrR family transcriptional regulator n=1 Tax=unclassified Streptomyces TaxID=2593676 RepID=UPI002253104E|nr:MULTISPECIES: TetR/AcrR family transcriptional regulator [unclassified Streptomyces]MCX5439012.1 TetR/AcrR family transcriptional regulator [Streptomyces sp. NBC_00063]WSE16592.1 TetR/AcrR family transcriptional regulator [Streptomyces sp. NBC_01397]WUB94489.1 TetR/AcrR family transcriptional regulator [Streptomyces sp. NBC_00569]